LEKRQIIGTSTPTSKTSDVLYQKGLRLDYPQSMEELRKAITSVVFTQAQATRGPRLTGWAADHHANFAPEGMEVNIGHS
jgi:hypothetical protein